MSRSRTKKTAPTPAKKGGSDNPVLNTEKARLPAALASQHRRQVQCSRFVTTPIGRKTQGCESGSGGIWNLFSDPELFIPDTRNS